MHDFAVFLFPVVLVAASAQAQDAQVQPTIEVTATRVAETVDASLADVDVITRRDIDASNAPDLLELLRLQAGVDVARGGGAGEQTAVFVRGTNSNHVLVLIDGVRVASSNTGAFAFENLPLDAVERIEVVRGPRASYWGSDAIGGVIQIFTRKLDAPHIAASYGSYRSADGSAGMGHWSETGGFSVQFGARHVGGFSATNPGICNGPDDPYCIYNPDDNGYHNHDLEFMDIDGVTPYDVLMENTDPKLVWFQIDVGNLTFAGKDAISYLKKYPKRYFSMHAKDYKPGLTSVPVGQGILDWKTIFTLAKKIGIQNYFAEVAAYGIGSLHHLPAAAWPTDSVDQLRQSYVYLHNLKI